MALCLVAVRGGEFEAENSQDQHGVSEAVSANGPGPVSRDGLQRSAQVRCHRSDRPIASRFVFYVSKTRIRS